MFNLRKKNFLKLDLPLAIIIIILCLFGLLVLYSASLSLDYNPIKSQIIATILGFFSMIIILLIDYDFIKSLYKPIYAVSIFLLVLVFFFGTGGEEWGADIWLSIGPLTFQPSEFVKIGLIISLSRYIEINIKNLNKPLTLLKVLFFAFLPVILIVKEDFGSAAVIVFIIGVMLFTAGISYKYIAAVGILSIGSAPILYSRLDEFQKNRILNFLDPSRDITDTGFQMHQGKIAIGSGQLTGRGLFRGVQTQNNFIPEKQTDYIFPVLAEEFGFLGAFSVIILYGIMIYRMIIVAKNSKDIYGTLLTMGIAGMFLAHIFENIGMTIGIMPVTGIPLPFMSHGGTFQLTNLIAIGLVLAVSVERQKLDFS
ncbi:MAG: rod shape-determining protein RodA [Tissierellia bacterium]|nr:rod shape-determining protein RodA [Tissierellia bacterium]